MLEFSEFLPDEPTFLGGAGEALNVFASRRGYRPMQGLSAYSTTALTARCQGAAYFRNSAGTPYIFAGDATKLYLLSNTAFGDVSRAVGGAYGIGAEAQWQFMQFGSLVLACNGTDTIQKFDINAPDSAFTLLDASAPTTIKYLATMGDFVVGAHSHSGGDQEIHWSAINDATDWTQSATTQSDSQIVPDGGLVTGLVGYTYGGIVFQDRAIRSMIYEGSPIIFRFSKIANDIGATIPSSIASYGEQVFFCHRSGFFRIIAGQQIEPIGAGKVDRFFWDDIDSAYLTRVSSAVDPVNKLYGILYIGAGTGGGTTPNRMLLYHWDTGRWTRAQPGSLELIWSATSVSNNVDIDHMSSFGNIDTIPFSLDSPIWLGTTQPLFGGFDTDHNLGYFNGSNLAATIDTVEAEPSPGRLTLIRSARSMVETVSTCSPKLALGTRDRINDAVTFGTAMSQDADGKHPFRSNHRYQRGRLTLAAGQDWSHAIGVDVIDFRSGGRRSG